MGRPGEKRSYGLGRVFNRPASPNWYVAYMVNGEEKKESSKSTKRSVAVELLRRRQTEIEGGVFVANRRATVSDLMDLLEEDYRNEDRKSLKDVMDRVDLHVRPYFGPMLAIRVTKRTIEAYKKLRQDQVSSRGKPPSTATINRELSALKRAFNLGLDEEPPLVRRVPKIKNFKEPKARQGFFEDADFTRFYPCLPQWMKPVATFAYETSCRFEEIVSIRWEQVDLQNGFVRMPQTKNGQPRTIPLQLGDLWKIVRFLHEQRQGSASTSPWVFSREGKRITHSVLYKAWITACKAADLWDSENGRHTKIFHDFRRTACRNMRRAGLSESEIMLVGGWKTASVFRRYNIINEEDLRRAAEKVAAFRRLQADELRLPTQPRGGVEDTGVVQ